MLWKKTLWLNDKFSHGGVYTKYDMVTYGKSIYVLSRMTLLDDYNLLELFFTKH